MANHDKHTKTKLSTIIWLECIPSTFPIYDHSGLVNNILITYIYISMYLK